MLIKLPTPTTSNLGHSRYRISRSSIYFFDTARAAVSIKSATSLGCDTYTEWLAPATSIVWLWARAAYQRSRSGLMVLSFAATSIQLGLLLHAAVVMTALKLSARLKLATAP